MGATSYDMQKKERSLQRYDVNEASGVEKLLRDYHDIAERRYYKADYAACDLLLDLNTAIKAANLAPRQKQSVELIKLEYTFEEAGNELGVRAQTVHESFLTACEKIAAVFRSWEVFEHE